MLMAAKMAAKKWWLSVFSVSVLLDAHMKNTHIQNQNQLNQLIVELLGLYMFSSTEHFKLFHGEFHIFTRTFLNKTYICDHHQLIQTQ